MSKFFKDDELACSCCGSVGMDASFVMLMDEMREACGFPWVISSAYRCEAHPIEASKLSSVTGAHQEGVACDVVCSGAQALRVIEVAIEHGIKRIGVKQKGPVRFIHLDASTSLPSPAIWSY